MIKVQSISDIITNSSSEVFINYCKEDVNNFKNTIQKIIAKFGVEVDLDSAIEIVPDIDDYDLDDFTYFLKEKLLNKDPDADTSYIDDLTEDDVEKDYLEDLYDYMYEKTAESWEVGEYDYGMVQSLRVVPKSPEYQELADLICELINPFESEALYC